jgi:hypothetical protein
VVPVRQTTYADGIDSLESILGPLKSLKIRALSIDGSGGDTCWQTRGKHLVWITGRKEEIINDDHGLMFYVFVSYFNL